MDANEELAPAVDAILATAKERSTPSTGPISVDARSFADACDTAAADNRVPIIAEIKPTSPTTNGERHDDPVELARAMKRGGATAISVLTEPTHFGGTPEDLQAVRAAIDLPVLRKDFILDEAQLDTIASDLVLLIVRFLGDQFEHMLAAAEQRGFQPLVEVHTAEELDRALAAGADIIGINNRDLGQLVVDLSTFETLAPRVPDDVTLIAESGISDPDDAGRMRRAGADALLVGSAIMAGNVESNTARLVEAEQ